MQLVVERHQDAVKGMLGGHKGVRFTLRTLVQFSEEEQQLLTHYNMWGYSVMNKGGIPVSLREMTEWRSESFEGNNIEILLKNEAVQKRSLDSVPALFDILRSFGGRDVVTYPRTTDQVDSDLV